MDSVPVPGQLKQIVTIREQEQCPLVGVTVFSGLQPHNFNIGAPAVELLSGYRLMSGFGTEPVNVGFAETSLTRLGMASRYKRSYRE